MSSGHNTPTTTKSLRFRLGQLAAGMIRTPTCDCEQAGQQSQHSAPTDDEKLTFVSTSNITIDHHGSAHNPLFEREREEFKRKDDSAAFCTAMIKVPQYIHTLSCIVASRVRSVCFQMSWNLWLLFPVTLRRRLYLHLQDTSNQDAFEACRLPGGLALKVTRNPFLEVSNLRFVEANTSIPVPHVYDWVPSQGNDVGDGVVIMTWIEGDNLWNWLADRTHFPDEYYTLVDYLENGEDVDIQGTIAKLETFTPDINLSDASFVVDDLRQAISQLRALKPPGDGRVCGLNGQPLKCLRYHGNRDVPHKLYPVKDVPTFHQILLNQVGWKSIRLPRILQIGEKVLAKHYEIRFAHSDLNPTNILIKDGRLAAIIDWEMAGWYPEYWEYTMLHLQNRNRKPLIAFWRHVNPCGQRYEEELEYERALWHSSGHTFIPPGVVEDDPYDAPVE
ncbi:hypothetical protein CYLTODRAFT_425460 [Cylindrobasidium torrendii FP15055 ss-10]|uniref:Aminoglycoside phosphotransferase domain-containing protein n=1 Tax=Cylindrobasidium torrendii FP15055 ss-10 TaxID=1314674 RepID=A0A0D7B137_9AGAR|nr:hypothetical protein CYLTODRAFT_425460 [Cylindrobasidium torrendii FP15055 ss-10]